MAPTVVGPRIKIDEEYPGARKVYSNPDIFVIEDFLDEKSCQDIIEKAKGKTLERSPVAYAGWTEDVIDLVELAAKGPVAWLALVSAWAQVKNGGSQVDLVIHALQNYAAFLVLAVLSIAAFTYSRVEGLKAMRTSTSTTLDDVSNPNSGASQFVKKTAKLFDGEPLRQEAALFEAPTVIRYEPEQVLAPHFDANRSAETEDANRGGQTLATLIVYLNDVQNGGLTRFGKLPALPDSREKDETKLTIRPKMGDALLFFPADAMGQFDERTEHEGCPAVDEKWIARIWRHKGRVPPPFGLSESSLDTIRNERL
jgi:hypothetical protein